MAASSSPTLGREGIPQTNKSYTIPSTGHTYAYIYHPAKDEGGDGKGGKGKKATLLWLHGFPSTSAEWRHQTTYFSSLGYGILAPDLLGYGGTSKPLTLSSYVGKSMASEIISIIDHEKITGPIIAIGHDWGTYLTSRLATFHKERFEKFVFLSVPFGRPGVKGDVDLINRKTKEKLGYEQLGYQVWFAEGETGGILGENWEPFYNLVYPTDPIIWTTSFAPLGALKHFVQTQTADSSSHILAPWISPAVKQHHHSVFGNNYDAPLMWYKRGIVSLGWEEEKEMLDRGEIEGGLKGVDVLMIGGMKDTVCGADTARAMMKGSVEEGRLTCVDVDAGHWIMLERPDETNEILRAFFEGKVGEGSKL
ncbi:Alpha/Beta hydrolase protein [Leptodontidium sp. 2 PMI_412]|nr:Alpha/Beta hydrolase protein [Leptodontidium sp. 2 PMI_412]